VQRSHARIQPLVHVSYELLEPSESRVTLLESPVDLFEPRVDLFEPCCDVSSALTRSGNDLVTIAPP